MPLTFDTPEELETAATNLAVQGWCAIPCWTPETGEVELSLFQAHHGFEEAQTLGLRERFPRSTKCPETPWDSMKPLSELLARVQAAYDAAPIDWEGEWK
jgi:hypothetical protein